MTLLRPRPATIRRRHGGGLVVGFTLIELLLVVGLIALFLMVGIPRFTQNQKKSELGQSLSAVMEACGHARSSAILSGQPTKVVIRGAEDDHFSYSVSVEGGSGATKAAVTGADGTAPSSKGRGGFSRRLGQNVGIIMIDINFQDRMNSPERHEVRFFSNGTSDEFTLGMEVFDSENPNDIGIIRFVQLDSVTGLAYVKTLEQIRNELRR